MEDFLRKVIEGSCITPPEVCLQSFNKSFEGATNVEWYQKENYWEAIFFKNDMEHIAVLSPDGNLLEYKVNLSTEYLPEPVKNAALSEGEIMNCVLRNKGNRLEYEIIVRNTSNERFSLTMSDLADIHEIKKL